ncbi:MAG: NAD(P)/FAD-dependent oxidoreductase [Pseudomonadota bacterium]|nr:NAD(P)/FAD-dependent oxidoreductase [Pseudomonadota bacterium]
MASSGQRFREGLLFTHWDLRGPVSLQVSSYWSPGQLITINLIPDCDASGNLLDAKGHHGN